MSFVTRSFNRSERWKEDTVTRHNLFDKMRHYDDLSDEHKRKLYQYVMTTEDDSWALGHALYDLSTRDDTTGKQKVDLFGRYLSLKLGDRWSNDLFENSYKIDPKRTLNLLREHKDSHQTRRLLVLGTSLDDEVLGLRALSKSKYAPSYIFSEKYQPTLEALKQVPTIMRLKSLETLTSNIHTSYNVFGKITDDEEFKRLLFASTTRYRDRVEAVWEKYNEFKYIGKTGTVVAKFHCENCDEYELTLTSKVVRTKTKLEVTEIGHYLLGRRCFVCSSFLENSPQISGDIDGMTDE